MRMLHFYEEAFSVSTDVIKCSKEAYRVVRC
jgi:hypothetical protein